MYVPIPPFPDVARSSYGRFKSKHETKMNPKIYSVFLISKLCDLNPPFGLKERKGNKGLVVMRFVKHVPFLN